MNQLNIFDLINIQEFNTTMFGEDYQGRIEFGSDAKMKIEMDTYFKDIVDKCNSMISNGWCGYGVQLERDKGPYINFGITNDKGIIIKNTTITMLRLEKETYKSGWNMRAKFIREVNKLYEIDLLEGEQDVQRIKSS